MALLQLQEVSKHYAVKGAGLLPGRARLLKAVDGVDLSLERGRTLGIVGESGCGKSTLARLILRLIDPTAGRILFDGRDVTALGGEALRRLRREIQIVFQDPLSSLNPQMTVGQNVAEPLRFQGIGTPRERAAEAARALERVGLHRDDLRRYPHEFSGGQCQRIAIARALVLQPRLLVLDEPVSALDVSIRAQVLNLLTELQRSYGLAYVFISHDIGVVKVMSDRVAVMYLGKVVELVDGAVLGGESYHPYARSLVAAVPLPDPRLKRIEDFALLEGDLPSPMNPPSGCRFHTRCPHRIAECPQAEPALRQVAPGQYAACHLYR